MIDTRPVVATVGSIIVDLAVTTPRIPVTGENILARRFRKGPGGKGANASAAAALMGAESLLVGAVGDDDFGRMELAALRELGVSTSCVSVDPEAETGIAIIMVDDSGENTILVVLGANALLSEQTVLGSLRPHWESLDAVLVDFEIPRAVVEAVLAEAARRGVPSVLDAGPPRDYPADTWRSATVVSPNRLETEALLGHRIEGETALLDAARSILSEGPRAVVIKRGREGCLVCTAGEERRIPAFPVDVVDTTGAGDAFTAALTVAIAEGRSVMDAALMASAAGALATTRFGTMPAMPTRREVESLLARHSS